MINDYLEIGLRLLGALALLMLVIVYEARWFAPGGLERVSALPETLNRSQNVLDFRISPTGD